MAEGGDSKAVPVNPQFAIEGPVFQLMEDALEKLKILDYESKFCANGKHQPLERTSFALPGRNPSLQLQSFFDVVSWLVGEVTTDSELFKLDKYDDPNTSANKLVLAVQKLGFNLDFPVNKIKQAHGEAVCNVLDFLCNKALERKGFSWQRPVYHEEAEAEEADVDEDADAGGDVEDEAVVEEEEEAIFTETAARGAREDVEELEEERKVLESSVDPVKWKTELEKVSARLKVPSHFGGKDWREHIEQTKKNEQTIQTVFPDTKGQLLAISEDIQAALERMSTKELYINNQFDNLKSEFRTLKLELKEVETKYQDVTGRVGGLTNELATIVDRLEEIKDTMNDKGQSMTDTSPLVKIRTALQQIKVDIQEFDLRIGVVEHTLMHAKIRSEKSHQTRKHKGKQRANEPEPDVDLSDLENR